MSSAKVHDIAVVVVVEVGDGGGAGGGVLHWWTSGGGHLGLLELWATEYFDLKKRRGDFSFKNKFENILKRENYHLKFLHDTGATWHNGGR